MGAAVSSTVVNWPGRSAPGRSTTPRTMSERVVCSSCGSTTVTRPSWRVASPVTVNSKRASAGIAAA
ncbi:MAG: hypothetical protein U0168_31415 [Nannocystaceae bacterium]